MSIGRLWNLAMYGKVWGRGFSMGSSWTMDPSLLKGFRVLFEVKIFSSVPASAAQLAVVLLSQRNSSVSC